MPVVTVAYTGVLFTVIVLPCLLGNIRSRRA
jgi:hypothetical protein